MLIEKSLSNILDIGYDFVYDAISPEWCKAMEGEVASLNLEEGDHINYPINPGTTREVKQLHARMYVPVGHQDVPVASAITQYLIDIVKPFHKLYEQLTSWCPNEVGYQLYRDSKDWISPHRDRRNDQLLSATITIAGSAIVKMLEPIDEPDDYSNLKTKFEFLTKPGSIMWLRAPGFGNGKQEIHEVSPPINNSRLILNLRMRPNILKRPIEFLPARTYPQ